MKNNSRQTKQTQPSSIPRTKMQKRKSRTQSNAKTEEQVSATNFEKQIIKVNEIEADEKMAAIGDDLWRWASSKRYSWRPKD